MEGLTREKRVEEWRRERRECPERRVKEMSVSIGKRDEGE